MPYSVPRIDFAALAAFFPPDDLEWKPVTIARAQGKALAAAYVTNRAIMDRLDSVVGPDGWKNEFRPGPHGGVLCGLSLRIGDEWITKWDGAENTDIEPVKGGLSSSMRRAAVQWGIGRYLYALPGQWVKVDDRGRFVETPRLPKQFLPKAPDNGRPDAHAGEALPDRKQEEYFNRIGALAYGDRWVGIKREWADKVGVESLEACGMSAYASYTESVEGKYIDRLEREMQDSFENRPSGVSPTDVIVHWEGLLEELPPAIARPLGAYLNELAPKYRGVL